MLGDSTFMSKVRLYNDVKIIKKPLKFRIKKFFVFFGILGVFCVIFLASFALSAALSVGHISSFVVYGGQNINIKESSIYAVSLGEYEEKGEAEKVAIGSTIQGSSGYVWEDGKYVIIGNIYPKEEDAKLVVENLKNSNYDVKIKKITFPKMEIKFDYNSKQVNTIKKSLSLIDEIYLSLYNYSIKFDKKEMNNFAISSEISDVRGEVKIMISCLQDILKEYDEKVRNIQNCLILIDEVLDETILKTIDNSTTSYTLKNTIAKCIRCKYDLYMNI